MEPERWRQIERLYRAALERPESERTAFLETTCGGDDTLRRAVESLLAGEAQAEHFLESPAIELVGLKKATSGPYTDLHVSVAAPFPFRPLFLSYCQTVADAQDYGGDGLCLSGELPGCRAFAGCFLLTAWVFLPNHWRAILFPPYPLTISEAMKSVKLTSTNALGRLRGEAGELGQPRFFDHALRTVHDYWEKVEYIHLNPVRRGLVVKTEDWIWSSLWSLPARAETALRRGDRPGGISGRGQDSHLTGVARVQTS